MFGEIGSQNGFNSNNSPGNNYTELDILNQDLIFDIFEGRPIFVDTRKPNKIKNKNNIYEANDTTSPGTKKYSVKKSKKIEKLNKKKIKKKVKKIAVKSMIIYMNKIIQKEYGGEIGKGVINQKIIRNIDPSEIKNITIAHNKALLNKSLKEILSAKISKKYTSISPIIPDINKKIIDELLNEENEDKRKIFNDLFNKTFLDWLLMISDPKDELKDLYEKIISNEKMNENEINKCKEMIKNFEKQFLNEKM